MRTYALTRNPHSTRLELAMLLAASLGCVVVLAVGIVGSEPSVTTTTLSGPLLFGLALTGVAVLALVLFIRSTWASSQRVASAETEARKLRQSLATAEALVKAEPQVLIYWEHGKALTVVTHTLTGVPGLPTGQPELLRFGFWLDQRSAQNLKTALDGLFAEGRSFNIILKTAVGGHLEADGRAAGGRAVLRMRDVAGYKRDLSTILDLHANLARDVRASRALLDALPSPAWLRDQDGRLTWVNRAYAEAVEAASSAEAVSGQIELLESRQRRAAEKSIKSRQVYKKRVPIVAGGERKSHDVIMLGLGDATAGAAIDVAALEIAKGELDRQMAAYDRTLHRVATAVAIFNPEQRLTFFNEAYLRLWHLDAEWLRTQPTDGAILDRLRELARLPEVIHYSEWKGKLLGIYQSGQSNEDWWHLPDGRMIHVMAEQRPDGGVTYLYDDESERLSLESRYNALISAQSETLDNLKEGVAVFGTDGRLKLFNSAFAAIWRLSRRQLSEGPHVDELVRDASVLHDDPAIWARITEAITSFSDNRQPIEGQMVRPDQSVIDYAAAPLPDGGTLLTFADVTLSKSYERALKERNEALEAANAIKSKFIGHVSYELRTPLTNIIGFSELLESPLVGQLNVKQREYVEDISASSRTLLAIIDGILDLATIDAGTLELQLAPISVRNVIDEAILGVRERAGRAELTLDIAVAPDAGELVADKDRVRQILYNLLSNAVGFSKKGGTVHITGWRENGHIAISIEDQGIGIPPEQVKRAFERFESRSQGSSHRGAGLGLSIVKSLVKLHGGDVTLESELGRGTRVTVRFPVRAVPRSDTKAALLHDDSLDIGRGL